jgi:glutathione S-transferase
MAIMPLGLGNDPYGVRAVIILHHLETSRSHRILWLLEELGLPYEMVTHQRDPMTRLAPPALKAIHPLGKSPVIVDGDVTLAESGAIAEYLVDVHGGGRLKPAGHGSAWRHYIHWMHFAEGSAMLPLLLRLYTGFLGDAAAPLRPRIDSEIDNHFGYMNAHFAEHAYACGQDFTAADIQLGYVLEGAAAVGALERYPALAAYHARLATRPAYQAALAKGGPVAMTRR